MRAVRVLLVLLALLAVVPAIVHYQFVDHRLDSVRSFGLIPSHFLSLRILAQLSGCFAVLALAAFAWSFRNGSLTGVLLALCMVTFLLFATTYLTYTLFVVAVLLDTGNLPQTDSAGN